ncbi:MAG TPA: DUF6502 family protein [Steroidobacteraceae bacterium]|jgi:hypothetical protein|nr:DUF6502 family protein [Steroidobacteraceae bacterium]
MKPSKEHAAEVALAALLDVLASILVPLEITPARLSQIARTSFVKASAIHARMRSSGRPHLARIAALTGLSRAEVKRVVAANYSIGPRELESSPRALRVLHAWKRASGYSQGGRARSLRINGPFPSFESLCRDFSGDIPHKVILTELERRSRIKLIKNQSWVSATGTSKQREGFNSHLPNLIFAASLIGELSTSEKILIRRKVKIASSAEVQESYVENAIESRLTGLLDNLPELFVSKKNAQKNTNCVNVYTLVSANKRVRKPRS